MSEQGGYLQEQDLIEELKWAAFDAFHEGNGDRSMAGTMELMRMQFCAEAILAALARRGFSMTLE